MIDVLASFSYEPVQRWGPVSPHGVGTAVGFLLGAVIMARRAEPRGIPRQEVYNAVTWGAVGAIIGARGFYVLAHAGQFDSLRDVLAIWEGGLTMFGGFIGGLLLGLGYLRRHGFPIPAALDAAAPGFVAGVFMGRVGDLIIADHLGEATTFALGYRIPDCAPSCLAPGYGPPTYTAGAVVHQTALYDLLGVIVLAGALWALGRRMPRTGTLFAIFSLWYGLQRVLIDFTRNRDVIESFFFGLSGSQWAGLGFAIGGALWLGRIQSRPEAAAIPNETDDPAAPGFAATPPATAAEQRAIPTAEPAGTGSVATESAVSDPAASEPEGLSAGPGPSSTPRPGTDATPPPAPAPGTAPASPAEPTPTESAPPAPAGGPAPASASEPPAAEASDQQPPSGDDRSEAPEPVPPPSGQPSEAGTPPAGSEVGPRDERDGSEDQPSARPPAPDA